MNIISSILKWQCIAEGSVECFFLLNRELWVILMSTATNLVFCFLSFWIVICSHFDQTENYWRYVTPLPVILQNGGTFSF